MDREKLLEILDQVDTHSASQFRPVANCKAKVLHNALKKYAKDCSIDQVVAIMDTTPFCSGKEGFLLTEKRLYSNFYLKREVPERYLVLDDIADVTDGQKKGSFLLIMKDGSHRNIFLSVYADEIKQVLQAIIAPEHETESETQQIDQPTLEVEEPAANSTAESELKSEPEQMQKLEQEAESLETESLEDTFEVSPLHWIIGACDRKELLYLYHKDGKCCLMDQESLEEYEIAEDLLISRIMDSEGEKFLDMPNIADIEELTWFNVYYLDEKPVAFIPFH